MGGVFIASVASGFSSAYLISALSIGIVATVVFYFKKSLLVFMLAVILGSGYYFVFSSVSRGPGLIFGKKVELTGVVQEAEQRLNSQKLVINNIQLTTPRYPEFEYGDLIKAAGVINPPDEKFAGYFKKEGIDGLMQFPKLELVSKNHGSPLKAALLKIKKFFVSAYKKVLPFNKAVFLSGLTLGSTAEFSDEFNEKLRLTGTTHLVALSGYNISVIIRYVGGIFALWWITRRFKLILSIVSVAAFVVMTGAEPSVVRAAIMATILLLADQIRRVAYIPNIIAATALVMVLINPDTLVFDIGFQLSFTALIGIIYLEPWLREKFKAKKSPGILGWRAHFWTTTSAQLSVLPIIIYHFGFVSPVSILTNVLLLEFIPITMGLGFFTGFAFLVSYWLSWIIAIPAAAFLGYELTIIDIFSKIMNFF